MLILTLFFIVGVLLMGIASVKTVENYRNRIPKFLNSDKRLDEISDAINKYNIRKII